MNPDKKILVLVDWYLPGYKAGGPIRSCANLIANLKNEYSFRVVTGDTDLDEKTPYQGINSNAWNVIADGTPVFYFSANKKSYKEISRLLLQEQFDCLYLNSFFSVPFTLIPLLVIRFNKLKCRVIVAPRGMMGKGSLGIKPFKKKLFIHTVKLTGLFKNVTWHASTPGERDEIQAIFGKKANIRNAINLTAPRTIVRNRRVKAPGSVKFFCLARISPVKNIMAVFRYLTNVNPDYHISVDCYGTMEDQGYLDNCLEIAKRFNKNVTVSFKGPVENEKVQQMALQYHFMILPTFNENYGHAIVESLVAGCPVLISDRTPWRNLAESKAGWDLSLENDDLFTQQINICANMEQQEYDAWSAGAYELALKIVGNKDGIKQNRELFLY